MVIWEEFLRNYELLDYSFMKIRESAGNVVFGLEHNKGITRQKQLSFMYFHSYFPGV